VGVATVDEDVAGLEQRQEVGDALVHDRSRHHQPDRPRLVQLLHKFCERGGSHGILFDKFLHGFRRPVEDHALNALLYQPPDHFRANSSESNHPELHCRAPFLHRFAACSIAAHRRSIAAATPLRSPKTDVPATRTLAPAATPSGAVVASIPPSSSSSHPGLTRSIISRTRRIFGSVVWRKC